MKKKKLPLLILTNQDIDHPLLFQPGGQIFRLDVAVIRPVNPVAQIIVVQTVLEQGNDPGLRFLFDLADSGHSLNRLSHSEVFAGLS